jgi:type II secretory pathway pseudopilin PulG
MLPINQNDCRNTTAGFFLLDRKKYDDHGFTLIELMISMAITLIVGIVILSALAGFYRNGQEIIALDQRIANAAIMQSLGNHFLARANFVGQPQPAAQPLISPLITASSVSIEWAPTASVVCSGTLSDVTLPQSGVQINGLEWVSSRLQGTNGCDVGTSFFPVGSQWAFTSATISGCTATAVTVSSSVANAISITSNSDYGNSKLSGVSGTPTTQVVTVCLPNL